MVAKMLLTEKALTEFNTDTFNGENLELRPSSLNIFEGGMSKAIAADKNWIHIPTLKMQITYCCPYSYSVLILTNMTQIQLRQQQPINQNGINNY